MVHRLLSSLHLMKKRWLLFVVVWAFLDFQALAGSLSVEIPWEKSWPVMTPKTADTFGFTLKNGGGEPAELAFVGELISPSGQKEEIKQTLSLAAGEAKKIPWPLTGKEFGSWRVHYKLQPKEGEKDKVEKEITFGYMEPAGPNETRPAFMFGIVSHSERVGREERHRELEAAAFAGCKVLRAGSDWLKIQPAPGQWDWETMDDMVSTTQSLGIQIEALLAFTTRWAAPESKQGDRNWLVWHRAAPDLTAWRTFVSTYAQRYKGRIHLWETWNEPDLEGFWKGTTEEYIELLKVSIEELRKADSTNVVMSGGFATLENHPSRSKNPDLQERTMKALGPLLDAHAVHEHGPFDRFAGVVDGPYAAMRAALPKPVPPLFFNETAEHSMNGTEKSQAMILVKKASFARSRGAMGYLWYDLRNDGTHLHDPEHHFGLLTNAMEPKPAYIAFNTFARLVVPLPYLEQLGGGNNGWYFLFGNEREKILVFWNDDYSSQNEQVLIKLAGAKRTTLVDLNGNSQPMKLVGDLAVISSNQEPHYLRIEGAPSVVMAGRLAGPSHAFFGAPGGQVDVACEFTNPGATEVEVQVDWALPASMKLIKSAPQKFTIPAHGQGASSVTVQLPEGEAYQFGRDGKLRVNYQYVGLPYQGRILIPVQYGTIAVPVDTAGRKPDAILNQPNQLVSFVEADPQLVPYRWKGSDDLSAQIWFGADSQNLILRVAVTDNKHFLTGTPEDMWKGDSVQCVLTLPGQNGSWELGFGENNEGQVMVASWATPSGREDCRSKIRVVVEKQGEGRFYTAYLPRKELGLDDKMLREGFRFNLAVNDNDGVVRAHALQIAPGVVSNKSAAAAPYVIFKELPKEKP